MSAEPISAPAAPEASAAAATMRPVVGVLADGTPFYAPIGEIYATDATVMCHLCGRSFRSVTAHLRAHGWTKLRYCEAFGLERGQSLEGPETRKLRSAAFAARLVFEPAIRDGSATGRARAKAGALATDAAAAATGRPFPEQRRRKSSVRASGRSDAAAAASRARADQHLAAVAAAAAVLHGYADFGALVTARILVGASLASVSREIGQHKDWLSRHLPRLHPESAELARTRPRPRPDAAWMPIMRRLGYRDAAEYLHDRHLVQHRTVNSMAAELGVSHHAVESALARYGMSRVRHAAKRHAAGERAAAVAARLGFASIAPYVTARRTAGWTWNAIVAESGQPQAWLRRHARHQNGKP